MALFLVKSASLVGRYQKSGISSLSTKRTVQSISGARFFSGGHAPVKHDSHSKELDPNAPKPKEHHVEHLFPFEEGDYVPPTETHAVGDEKAEIDFGSFDQTVLKGGFGTMQKPINVPSRFHSRIVGCTGSKDVDHEVLWHEVRHGKDLICMECGQVFHLDVIPGFEHLGHHHHGEHDDHHDEPAFGGHVDGDGFRFMYPPKSAKEIAAAKAERDEELRKDPKAPPKKVKATGVDYHNYEEKSEEGRLSSKAPVFHDLREQEYKDRK